MRLVSMKDGAMDDVQLEPEQEALLTTLAEAHERTSPERREEFYFGTASGSPHNLHHPGLPGGSSTARLGDIEMLDHLGLLLLKPGPIRGTYKFDLTPRGLAHYRLTKVGGRRGELVTEPTTHEFAVAFSFAGPQRPLAERLANMVRDAGFNVFYDAFYEADLWGKDLNVSFDDYSGPQDLDSRRGGR